MISVSLPKKPKFEKIDENAGRFIIENCYPGYGITLGNTLRRVLLSSLSGAAAVAVKIKGITHEFVTLKGIKEDAVQIILNLKQLYFKLDEGTDEAVVTLKSRGNKREKEVTAKEIKCPSNVQIANPDKVLATLTTSTANLEMEIKVKKGIGFVAVEAQNRKEKEIGSIAVDAIFNPVLRVNFSVENMRVGKRTDYDKITLDIFTNGTVTPEDVYEEAVEILMSQFNAISSLSSEDEEAEEATAGEEKKSKKIKKTEEKTENTEEETGGVSTEELNLSTRTKNILDSHKLQNVRDIAKYSENKLRDLEGMGDKGIKEIKKGISKYGIILKAEKDE